MGRPPFKRVCYTKAPIKYLRIAIVACVAMLMYVGHTKVRSGSILMWRLQSPRTRHHTSNDNCIDGRFLRNNTTRRRYRFIILQWHHICALASQISINSTLCSTAFFGLTTEISYLLSEISRSCLRVSLTFLHFHRLLQFSALGLVQPFSTSKDYYRSLWSRLTADKLICLPSINGEFQS